MKKRVPKRFVGLVGGLLIIGGAATWFFTSKLNTIDPESDLVQKLYSYLGDTVLDYCGGMPFYESGTVDYKSLDQSTKVCLAYKMLDDEKIVLDSLKKDKKADVCTLSHGAQFQIHKTTQKCHIEVIQLADLKETYFKLFGHELEATDSFELTNTKICYLEEEKSRFACGDTPNPTLQLGWTPTTYRMIKKVKEKGNEIYIYDYYIAINDENCYLTNRGDHENTRCSKKINEKTEYNAKFVIKYGLKYAHIFEKDSNNIYHWISSSVDN